MYTSNQLLTHDADFDNVMWFCKLVNVIQEGEIIAIGKIISNSEYAICINDGCYLKEICEFRVC